jgi:SHS2 domain-containing protein
VNGRYELFDHTADAGVRAFAPTLPELVPPAVAGLYAVIGRLTPTPSREPAQFNLTGEDAAMLLRDLLAELLTRLMIEGKMAVDWQVREFTPARLSALAWLSSVDRAASEFQREAKGVTYHQLAVRPVAGGYEATFIVDI